MASHGNRWLHTSVTATNVVVSMIQVMSPATSQEEVFTEIEPLLQSVMDGSAPTLH